MEWTDLSQKARDVMHALGEFGPTVHEDRREIKGACVEDGFVGQAYYSSSDLREIAAGCIEVADWLDKRACIT